jgi:hypothetical protein
MPNTKSRSSVPSARYFVALADEETTEFFLCLSDTKAVRKSFTSSASSVRSGVGAHFSCFRRPDLQYLILALFEACESLRAVMFHT